MRLGFTHGFHWLGQGNAMQDQGDECDHDSPDCIHARVRLKHLLFGMGNRVRHGNLLVTG